MDIVACSSPNQSQFAVVNVTNAATPAIKLVNTSFGGCVLDVDENILAAGDPNGPQVALYDVTNPAAPLLRTLWPTGLSEIGAISISGNRMLVGEAGGTRAVFVDISNPAAPVKLSTFLTGISSIASLALDGNLAVASGPNDFLISVINLTNAANPTKTTFSPQIGGNIAVDLSGTAAVAGAADGGEVVLMNVASGAAIIVSRVNTPLRGIFSLSLDGGLAVAGSIHDAIIAVINFAQPSPSATSFNPGVGTGVSVAVSGGRVGAGGITGTQLKVLTTTGSPIASATGVLSSITGVALSSFSAASPPPPPVGRLKVNPTSIAFGDIAVCLTQARTLELINAGNAPVAVSSITAAPPFSVVPAAGATVQPAAKITRQITFKPAGLGGATGSVVIKSNDPTNATITVPLSGNALPSPAEIVPTTRNLLFGACLPDYFIAKRVHFRNASKCNTLTITSVSTGSAVFPMSRVNEIALPNVSTLGPITLPPGANVAIFVFFAPPTEGSYSGTLTVTSNAADEPFMQIPISGVAVPPPPTSVCLLLDVSGTMAEPAVGGTKLEAMKRSALLFNDLLPLNSGDFAAGVAFTWDLRDGVNLGAVTPAHKGVVADFINRQTVRVEVGAAGHALLMGLRALLNAPTPRRVLLLFSDGYDGAPEREVPTVDDIVPQVVQGGVEVYCVALGAAWNINAAALHHIANATRGRVFYTFDPLLLHKNFVQVLADAFRMKMAADPVHALVRGTVLDVKSFITRCERRVRFVCTWDDPGETVGFRISAPDGTPYTPASVAQNRLIRFGQRPCTAFFDLQFPPIDEGEDTFGPQVTGAWTLHLDGRRLNASSMRVTTAVVVDSHLKLSIDPSARFEIARAGMLTLAVAHEGEPLAGAKLQITLQEPLVSLQEVRSRTSAQRQSLPTRSRHVSAIAQSDSKYAVRLPKVWRDGFYSVEIMARIGSCGGTAERYGTYTFVPAQSLSRLLSTLAVAAPRGSKALTVRFTPRDRAGNLLGPGQLRKIALTPRSEASVLSGRDCLDGSYEFVLLREHAIQSVVQVRFGGQELSLRVPARPSERHSNFNLALWLYRVLEPLLRLLDEAARWLERVW